MKHFKLLVLTIALSSVPAFAAKEAKPAPSPEAEATYKDIEATLGLVPEFFKLFPQMAISGAWEEMKGIALNPATAIPGKYKELIGLAVSAQVPCKYCVYFHTQTAKLNGASEDEIKHALAEASLTRHWSTYLNGLNQDEAAFKAEITRGVDFMKKQMAAPPPATPPAPMALTDVKSVHKDIESMFGFVPTFMKMFPEEGLVGAWKEYKAIEGNPGAPIDGKNLALIGLAISAQIPCRYCIVADSEFAKLGGATEREMREAFAMASLVRHWSTFLNGAQVDEGRFKKDVDQMVAVLKKRMTQKAEK